MSKPELNTRPNIDQADDFYAQLIDMHRDFSPQQSAAANAALILLLANHIGDLGVLQQAFDIAREEGRQLASGRP
ncbi:DUF2783 domain-containing protein [Paraherbaspirillum soli]|uniref:DUF2783 domain-containing protein n=1 Tax=Paraherbaspirillum soli TaxID=631222 RepID=A0ABW0M883_9BURK